MRLSFLALVHRPLCLELCQLFATALTSASAADRCCGLRCQPQQDYPVDLRLQASDCVQCLHLHLPQTAHHWHGLQQAWLLVTVLHQIEPASRGCPPGVFEGLVMPVGAQALLLWGVAPLGPQKLVYQAWAADSAAGFAADQLLGC